MSPPPGSNGDHRQRMVSSMVESGGTATRRFNWKGPAIVLGKKKFEFASLPCEFSCSDFGNGA
jgi:hypothetical protein